MSRRGRSSATTRRAAELLAMLGRTEGYRDRLDGALGAVGDLAERPDCYLYVLEPGGLRFHLEHTKARPAADPSRRAPGPMERIAEGGAEWSLPTPPFELTRSEADELPRVVATPVGPLWSMPVVGIDGEMAGLIQVGPVQGDSVPRQFAAAYGELAPALGSVVAIARHEEEMRLRLTSATAQLEAGRRLAGSALDVERLVTLLLELALASTRTEAGFVAIQDAASGELQLRASSGMPEGFAEGLDLSPGTGLLDWSASDGGALFLRDLEAAERLGISSLLAVPLVEDSEALGVFALVNFGGGDTFTGQSLELLGAFADQIRLMLHNARLFGSFAERYMGTVQGLAQALDSRRSETTGHHEAVSSCAVALAQELGFEPSQVDAIRTAGLIHDVGLAGSAEGRWEADVEHPTVGASLVAHLPLDPSVSDAVATHHEWFDGWGFPNGLVGEAISPAGRVMAVAEFLVEMATEETVRPALSPERLAEELTQRRGSQFEPRVADAAQRLLERQELPLGQGAVAP
jgi:putative nucleotidyltransferase with HDIG domain